MSQTKTRSLGRGHRKSWIEEYRSRISATRRKREMKHLVAYAIAPMPQMQTVFECGVSAGMDPSSMDPIAENPEFPKTKQRDAWTYGWILGAEFTMPTALEPTQ